MKARRTRKLWIAVFAALTAVGALLRLLGEAAWLPTLLRDGRYVTWTAVDASSARATLRIGGREVTATFHFSEDGLLARFTAERFRDEGGRGVLAPFTAVELDRAEPW